MDEIPIQPLSDKVLQRHPTAKGDEPKQAHDFAPPEDRRDFLSKAAAVVTGGAITACPVAAGVAVLIDPLTRSAGEAQAIRVASLSAIPESGEPQQFPVIVEHRDDAWTRYRHEPIGSVFIRRIPGSKELHVFNASCTHAGCFVAFDESDSKFKCPCHVSVFAIDGAVLSGPPPRPMDTLEYEIRGDDVYVKFQDFYTGIGDKKAKV